MLLPVINAGPQSAGGKVHALAVTSCDRLAAIPDLPMISESGSSGYESSQWYEVRASVGTTAEILNLLNSSLAKIMQGTDMKTRMAKDGRMPVGGSRE